MRQSRIRCLIAGLTVLCALPPGAIAQDSSQCGGMSLTFDGNCGDQTRFVRVCFADGGESAFDLRTGESHRLWVSQGATYNGYCGEEALACPGEFTIALESCGDAPPQPASGKRMPKTEGG